MSGATLAVVVEEQPLREFLQAQTAILREALERNDMTMARNTAAFERFIAASERNSAAFDRFIAADDRNAAAHDRLARALDRFDATMVDQSDERRALVDALMRLIDRIDRWERGTDGA